MKLYIDDRFISFIYSNKEEEITIKDFFTYSDSSNAFFRGKFDKNRIKKVCFAIKKFQIRKKYNFLFSGFLYEFLSLCKKEKFSFQEVVDKRTKYPFQIKDFSDDELKSYLPEFDYVEHQVEALRKLLASNNGIIKAPTASGKTELMIAFFKIARLPTLILVNRVSLVLQTAERIKENGIKSVGVCYGKGRTDGDIVVSTIGSVKKIPNLYKFKILIGDEIHRFCSNQFQTFLQNTSFPLRYGFSATPEGNDAYKFAKVRQFFGSIIYEVDPSTLIEKKVIALPRINFVKVRGVPAPDWASTYIQCIVGNELRNRKIEELVNRFNTKTLILVRMIEHGETLANLIPYSIFLSGIDDAEIRRNIVDDFENNGLDTIIATSIFDEGISINAIRLLIIASAGKSKIQSIQRLGRGLRLDEGKSEVLIYDFEDTGNYFTERHSELRKKTYRKAGFGYTIEK